MGLINRKACKEYCLAYAGQQNKKATRVSGGSLAWLEGEIKNLIEERLRAQDGSSKTIQLDQDTCLQSFSNPNHSPILGTQSYDELLEEAKADGSEDISDLL